MRLIYNVVARQTNIYARVGGVSLNCLALLELELLWRVQWRIVPKPEVLIDYYRSLIKALIISYSRCSNRRNCPLFFLIPYSSPHANGVLLSSTNNTLLMLIMICLHFYVGT